MKKLRKCSEETTYRSELLGGCSIIRELHVYGSVVPVSGRDDNKFQHQGFGVLLMNWAEKIAIKEHESVKIAVISGVGTRNYYRKLGYELEGPYMVKSLVSGKYKSSFEWVDGDRLQIKKKSNNIILQVEYEDDDDVWLEEFDRNSAE
ncbi:hypothetical protein NQ314_004625 [Rhamnusium bicolor]|uniref:N-acetyltransferase domain-containing protein n=1 Tax=Rhamnusium bicolor TaxID=1586634 RepID=A0AAV8ZL97_9CUCU|nr:hypothetical protein NQ314_004625 [Rhamnusium bicolor]